MEAPHRSADTALRGDQDARRILSGGFRGRGTGTVLLSVVMKTMADVGMHRFDHRNLQRETMDAAAHPRK